MKLKEVDMVTSGAVPGPKDPESIALSLAMDSQSEADNNNTNNNNLSPARVQSHSAVILGHDPSPAKLALRALELVSQGDLARALMYLDACLDPEKFIADTFGPGHDKGPPKNGHSPIDGQGSSDSDTDNCENDIDNDNEPEPSANGGVLDRLNLLEKRCLILLKLRKYDQVWENARRILEQSNHPVAFKCLIVALCKLNKLDQVREVLKLWEKSCPGNLDMMSCRTKVQSLLNAVNHGLDGFSVFEGIEDALALSPDWLLGTRKAQDPRWKYRPVPSGGMNPNQFVLCLQYRFGHCSLGEKCTDAHGEQELEEWKSRIVLAEITSSLDAAKLDSCSSYLKSITKKLQENNSNDEDEHSNSNSKILLTSSLQGVNITLNSNSPPLEATIVHLCPTENTGAGATAGAGQDNQKLTWDFTITSPASRPLQTIALLHDLHRLHFRISGAHFKGAKNHVDLRITGSPGPESSQVLSTGVSSTAFSLSGGFGSEKKWKYTISVQFVPPGIFGTFRQRVLFDFGSDNENSRKIVYRDIVVEVVPGESGRSSTVPGHGTETETTQRMSELAFRLRLRSPWTPLNAMILDSDTGEKIESTDMSMPKAKAKGTTTAGGIAGEKLSKENYKERMMYFLSCEQTARQAILSKYNVSARLKLRDSYERSGGIGTVYAAPGHLFAVMESFRDISEDSAVGRLILRSCNTALISSTAELLRSEKTKCLPLVYLVRVVDKAKNSIYFDIGPHCVETLGLQLQVEPEAAAAKATAAGSNKKILEADIQFQLDKTTFNEQIGVIQRLTPRHLELLFPNFDKPLGLQWNPTQNYALSSQELGIKLNPKQKEAIAAVITSAGNSGEPGMILPPILLIGPFGTGKTFTIFQSIKYLLLKKQDSGTGSGEGPGKKTRIMICTHSNSAADLYIKEYLDPLVESGHSIARPLRIYYTGRNLNTVHPTVLQYCVKDSGTFRLPTRDEILSHHVIVVTLSTSYSLISMDLPEDTFSHIFLDEAAQALETEAITPILSAGPQTKIVLAGDHMQLSPETFSEDSRNFHASLLERLHCLYPDSSPIKLMLCENYRSHSTIIQFASDSFYSAKLLCGKIQPVHDTLYPLSFFTARGEDCQDPSSTSYYNVAEVYEVVDRVSWLISFWPESWGNWKSDSAIGVLTPYADQVQHIRQRLRARGLSHVSVERVLNVQGKQFRAVFLSTVRTSKPWVKILPDSIGNELDLGFFSNPKLLNTALTRAQSLVAVVGDPVSLCSLGKCRRLWEDYIRLCAQNRSLYGMSWTCIREGMLGLELKGTYGFNPLAEEFSPDPTSLNLRVKEHQAKELKEAVAGTLGESAVSKASSASTTNKTRLRQPVHCPSPPAHVSIPVHFHGPPPPGVTAPQPPAPVSATTTPQFTFSFNPNAMTFEKSNVWPQGQGHETYYPMVPPGFRLAPRYQQQPAQPPPPNYYPLLYPQAQFYPPGGPRQPCLVPRMTQPVAYVGPMAIGMGVGMVPIRPQNPSQMYQPLAYPQHQIPRYMGMGMGMAGVSMAHGQGPTPSAFVEYCPTARNVPQTHPQPQPPPIHSNTAFPPLPGQRNGPDLPTPPPPQNFNNQIQTELQQPSQNFQGQMNEPRKLNQSQPQSLLYQNEIQNQRMTSSSRLGMQPQQQLGYANQNQAPVPRNPPSESSAYQNQVLRNPPSQTQAQTPRLYEPQPDLVPRNPPPTASRFFSRIDSEDAVPRNPPVGTFSASEESDLKNILKTQIQDLDRIWSNPCPPGFSGSSGIAPDFPGSSATNPSIQRTQIFSPQEISYLQKLLSEQESSGFSHSSQNQDTTLQALRAKLAFANQLAEAPVGAGAMAPESPPPQEFSMSIPTLDPDWPYSRIWSNHAQISASAVKYGNQYQNPGSSGSSTSTSFPIYSRGIGAEDSNTSSHTQTLSYAKVLKTCPAVPPGFSGTSVIVPPAPAQVSRFGFGSTGHGQIPQNFQLYQYASNETSNNFNNNMSSSSVSVPSSSNNVHGNQQQQQQAQILPLFQIQLTRPTPVPGTNSVTFSTSGSGSASTSAAAAPVPDSIPSNSSSGKKRGKKGNKRK